MLDLGEQEKAIKLIKEIQKEITENHLFEFQHELFFLKGRLQHLLGDFQKEFEYYKLTLSYARKIYGLKHSKIVNLYTQLADVSYRLNNLEMSEKYYVEAIKLQKDLSGMNHPKIADIYKSISAIFYARGNYRRIEEVLKKALEIKKNLFGDDFPEIASIYSNLAVTYQIIGKWKEANFYLNKSLEKKLQIYGNNHPLVGQDYLNLAHLNIYRGEFVDAGNNLVKAIKILNKNFPHTHPNVLYAMDIFVEYLTLSGTFDKSLKLLNRINNTKKGIIKEGDIFWFPTMLFFGINYLEYNEVEKTEHWFNKAYNIIKNMGESIPEKDIIDLYQVKLLITQKRIILAKQKILTLIENLKSKGDNASLYEAYNTFADICIKQEDYENLKRIIQITDERNIFNKIVLLDFLSKKAYFFSLFNKDKIVEPIKMIKNNLKDLPEIYKGDFFKTLFEVYKEKEYFLKAEKIYTKYNAMRRLNNLKETKL